MWFPWQGIICGRIWSWIANYLEIELFVVARRFDLGCFGGFCLGENALGQGSEIQIFIRDFVDGENPVCARCTVINSRQIRARSWFRSRWKSPLLLQPKIFIKHKLTKKTSINQQKIQRKKSLHYLSEIWLMRLEFNRNWNPRRSAIATTWAASPLQN